MSKEHEINKQLLKALVDVIDDLRLRAKLSEYGHLDLSDSVLIRAQKAIQKAHDIGESDGNN